KGTSTVTLIGAAQTVSTLNSSNGFYNLAVSGTITESTAIDVSNSLTVAGTLTTGGFNITGGSNLVVPNGGTLAAGASACTFTNVTMTGGASGTITLTGAWTVSGSWNTSGAGSTLTPGTSTVTMTGSAQTVNLLASQSFTTLTITGTINQSSQLTASALNLNSGSVTKGTNPLTVNGNLTLAGGALLSTSGPVVITGNVNISAAGSYIAFGSESWTISGSWTNASTSASWAIGTATVTFNSSSDQTMTASACTVRVSNLSMNGGTSGTITLTSGVWTVSGSWDSTGLGSILNSDTSTVTFTGTSQTIGLASGQMFYNLTIGGKVSTTSTVTAAGALTVNNGAVLTKTGQNLAFNALTEIGTGSIVDGTVIVVGFSVTNTDATNLTTISVFTNWTADTQYTWTDFSSVGTSTITFTIGGNTVGNRFNVTKDGALFTNGIVDGSGQVVFTMLAS